MLQKVRCREPTCRCARTGGELHGPYWYLFTKKSGKTKSKYVGKNRHVGRERVVLCVCVWMFVSMRHIRRRIWVALHYHWSQPVQLSNI